MSRISVDLQRHVQLVLAYLRSPAGKRHLRYALVGGASAYVCAQLFSRSKPNKSLSIQSSAQKSTRKSKKLNQKFFNELKWLIQIMVPGLWCKETGVLLMHSGTLISRTFLSIYVAYLEGRIVQCIVKKDIKMFGIEIAKWLLIALPATFINSMIKYFESLLGVLFRTRLVDKAYKDYFQCQTYYRVNNMDSRLPNADQCLTEDISKFTEGLARLYSDLTKPFFDLILISVTMITSARKRGTFSPEVMGLFGAVVFFITARTLRMVSPNFGQIVAEEARRSGHLRYVHSRVITNSEEIAFYGGHKVEHSQLQAAYDSLKRQLNVLYRKRIFYVMMEQFLMKYVWSSTGMIMVAVPILTAQYASDDQVERLDDMADGGSSERTRAFIASKNMLISVGDAAERLMSSVKKLNELAGYTTRVCEMFNVFTEMRNQKYQRVMVTADNDESSASSRRYDISQVHGSVTDVHGYIAMEDVPIVTPNGDVVVESLSLQINSGTHLLVTGPNGCGKSSLFRVLGGLWPVYRGHVDKPAPKHMYYVPQRPYMTLGTLRDQVIYPDTKTDLINKGLSDRFLYDILKITHLTHIVAREGGWDACNDWMDVLSGGEKQRVGLARVFYHHPEFVLLDECTSAVSIDVEGSIYQAIKDAGITLITITHRPTLWHYHTHLLQFDGNGGWKFSTLAKDDGQILTLAEEKEKLETEKEQTDSRIRNRLREIDQVRDRESLLSAEAAADDETVSADSD